MFVQGGRLILDLIDKKLLNIIQKEFPLSSKPYKDVGEILGISEKEVIDRVKNLKEEKMIRRIGGIFNPKALGYRSTLVALEVESDRLEEVASRISVYPEVTHNYQRNHRYNLWFTIIAENEDRMKEIIDSAQKLTGVKGYMNLPSIRLFKIATYFSLNDKKM